MVVVHQMDHHHHLSPAGPAAAPISYAFPAGSQNVKFDG